MNRKRAFVFDIDGVLVNVSARQAEAARLAGLERGAVEGRRARLTEEFWRLFFSEELLRLDRPRRIGIKLLEERAGEGVIVVYTGRPERLREATLEELRRFGVSRVDWLVMRRDGDRRPDYVAKVEELSRLAVREGLEVVEVHDDSPRVLERVRRLFPEARLYLHYPGGYKPFGASLLEFFD